MPERNLSIDEQRAQVILSIKNISVSFDGFYALSEVDIDICRGDIHFFIGPNGAGKTTLLDIICGRTQATAGSVLYYPQAGQPPLRLTSLKEYRIANAGVVRKFQVPSVFVSLTVWENMMLSLAGNKGLMASLFSRTSKAQKAQIEAMLERFDLLAEANVEAGALAHGKKQHLEIAMQFLAKPGLVMLDEPAAGMGRAETTRLGQILREFRDECTIIVVEHDMEFVKQIADKVSVLHEGRVLLEGTVEQALADETVKQVYLGRGGEV